MRVGSVCSGISADAVAWQPFGWKHQWFAEIDAFPSAVLAHRFPEVPNLGDFTKIKAETGSIDLLVGGTPCQSFSVAGLRKGMDDDRGNLALEFCRLAGRLGPRWVVWENVPGVLSSNGGRDFGSFLGAMAELGYGFAYRILDAQYVRVDGFGRAVPQRRRRVFLVGYLGDWRRAAAVLFDRESVSRNSPPGRQAESDIASALTRSLGSGGPDAARAQANHLVAGEVARAINTRSELSTQDFVVAGTLPSSNGGVSSGYHPVIPDVAFSLRSRRGMPQGWNTNIVAQAHDSITGKGVNLSPPIDAGAKDGPRRNQAGLIVAHTLRGTGYDASEDGTGYGTPMVPVAYRTSPNCGVWETGDRIDALTTGTDRTQNIVAFQDRFRGDDGRGYGRSPSVSFDHVSTIETVKHWHVTRSQGVRRLTPRECERLMGFPDDWTLVPYRGNAAKDGPRYKAIGNSMAVNCMRWIGWRIKMIEQN